ncbi:MAG: hypothetical protein R3B66_06570 [Candidatus Scalinduaceae bacterium]
MSVAKQYIEQFSGFVMEATSIKENGGLFAGEDMSSRTRMEDLCF